MSKDNTISVVTLTWNREPERLRDLVWTLTHQTVMPNEIIVVDGNTDKQKRADTIEAVLPFTNYYGININIILAHMDRFNLSKGFNIGIKRTSEDSKYVLMTGIDMLFGPNAIEIVLSKINENAFCVSHCGFLTKGVQIPNDPFSQWDNLCKYIDPSPPTKISTGALIAAPRDWWFEYRGYDEINHAFRFADSDVTMRMKLSGLKSKEIHWNKVQLLHVWHDPLEARRLVDDIGGEWPNKKWGALRNPNRWGEYD